MSILPTSLTLAEFGAPSTRAQRSRYGKTYQYDFDTRDFVVDGLTGKVVVLDNIDAFKQSIEKIWRTERGKYLIYTRDYGADVIKVAREGADDADQLLLMLDLAASEGAMSDPRTAAVSDLELTLDDPLSPTTVQIICNILDVFGVMSAMDVTVPIA